MNQVAQRGCGGCWSYSVATQELLSPATQLDYVLGNQLRLTLLEQLAWTKGSQEVPSNPNDSEIL